MEPPDLPGMPFDRDRFVQVNGYLRWGDGLEQRHPPNRERPLPIMTPGTAMPPEAQPLELPPGTRP